MCRLFLLGTETLRVDFAVKVEVCVRYFVADVDETFVRVKMKHIDWCIVYACGVYVHNNRAPM